MSTVYLLFGGVSSERLVSVATAKHILTVCPDVVPLFWADDGAVAIVERAEVLAHKDAFTAAFAPRMRHQEWPSIDRCLDTMTPEDCVYLGLHGGAGEDGTVQELCEKRQISYTCSDSKASALAMSKPRAKDVLRRCNVAVAADIVFNLSDKDVGKKLREFQQRHQQIVIKPAAEGSSAGLAFMSSSTELETWLNDSHGSTNEFIAEERLNGREFTIGVVDFENHVVVLPCSEVILERNAHFDYKGKYLGQGNKEITPADVTKREALLAQKVAFDAHVSLGCFGYTRTEVIYTDRGFYFLETNTLPGLTEASFIPQQLRAAGINVEDFLRLQIRLAINRSKNLR